MRLFTTLLSAAVLGTCLAQTGPCDGLQACFVPTPLPSGGYFFNNCSSNQNTAQFTWDFGDGSAPVYTLIGEHGYAQPGTYEVCLIANWGNCSDTTCTTVVVQGVDPCQQLQADFGSFTQGSTVEFVNSSFGLGVQTEYIWNFGDGSSSSLQDPPAHTYAQPGTYEVCLIAISHYPMNGSTIACTSQYCSTVTIGQGSTCAGFAVEMAWNAAPNGTVVFTATSNRPGTNFIWYFGDGTQALGPTAVHTYAQNDSYAVCVSGWYYTTATQDTCWVEDCEPVVVVGAPCDGLDACYTVDAGTLPGVIFFENCSSELQEGSYSWDFGDGSDPATGIDAEHGYAQPGTYQVCLTATWNDCTDTQCMFVMVTDLVCGGVMANFGSSVAGNVVEFDNVSTGLGVGTQWQWSFGDGTTSTMENPAHTYASGGVYQVCLTVTTILSGPFGQPTTCQDTYCASINAFGGSTCAGLNAFFAPFASGLGVNFSNATTGTGTSSSFTWYFGDGTTSNDPQPFHQYAQGGTYEVCLLVLSTYPGPNGQLLTCTDEYCAPVVLGGDLCGGLIACFLPLPFENGAFAFENCTQDLPIEAPLLCFWDFGDGTSSNETQPDHVFAPGTYTVCLTVTQGPCVDSTCTTITVEGGPCAGSEACFQPSQLSSTGFFFNNCSSPGSNATFVWLFNDGTTSAEFAPIHTFPGPGFYNVCLLATWPNGCTDEHCVVIAAGEDPCEGLNACFVTNYMQQPGSFFFDNCSQAPNGTQFAWDFGDGTSSTVTNVDHVYSQNGEYTVCLTAFYGNCVDSTCATIVVNDAGDFCDALVACFEPTEFSNNVFVFENCSQLLPIGIPPTYLWNFGDGGTSISASPEHMFAPGTYNVCLTLTHGTCVDMICYTVEVGTSDPCAGLVACFGPLPFENGAYLFEDCSQILPIAVPVLYASDFGDGGTSNESDPDHAFAPGTYTVCLTITQGNCTDSMCSTLTVLDPNDPCAGLSAGFSTSLSPSGVQFSNTTGGMGLQTTFLWNFGDGASSTQEQPFHTYLLPGTYEVCLVAISIYQGPDGQSITCTDEYCSVVIVNGGDAGCNPDYAVDLSWTNQGNAVILVAVANTSTDGYVWDFGDGTAGEGQTITHLYEPPGPYEICVNAWYWNDAQQDTCWATTCQLIDPFATALEELDGSGISIHPVPARDMVTINGLPTNAQLRVFAVDGRLLLTERATTTTQQLSVAGLATASYVLRVDADGRSWHRKLVVE